MRAHGGRVVSSPHAADLADHARSAIVPDGFGWLDGSGGLLERPIELWITTRMTHVLSLDGVLRSDPLSTAAAGHGVGALLDGPLRDEVHGGWRATTEDDSKQGYGHAFVVLAGAGAAAAGVARGEELLTEALAVFTDRFVEGSAALVVDAWDRGWTDSGDYRGLNATMHTVEALLAAHDVTGDPALLDRAVLIAEWVAELCTTWDAGLPEHFDLAGRALPEYHRRLPADPFRPYGVTLGHLFEWARLLTQVDLAAGSSVYAPTAAALVARARRGWADPGFGYTTDFDGTPVVAARMHWVVTEAVMAARTLGHAADADAWWDWGTAAFRTEDGSWRHELDEQDRPAATVWVGRPDVYHAWQATMQPLLPPTASFAGAVLTH